MAYNRDWVYNNPNVSPWINTKERIVLHHTWSIGGGNLPILAGQTSKQVSVHFLITQAGKAYKLCDVNKIARHAGQSQRGNHIGMNSYSIWIEIEGNDATPFTDAQYKKVIDVVRYLQTTFNIPKEKIIKHSDITRAGSSSMQLRDWKSPARKTDVSPRFWRDKGYPNYTERRNKVLL